jgi:hypothetical protein
LVIWVVQVVEEHLKSLKVVPLIEAGSIFSEKVAATSVLRATPVVELAGLTVPTLGAVVSGGGVAVAKVQL